MKIFAIITIHLILASCTAKHINFNTLLPSKSVDLKAGDRIAVLPFNVQWQGESRLLRDDHVSNTLNRALTNLQVNEKPYFNVMDSSTLTNVLNNRSGNSMAREFGSYADYLRNNADSQIDYIIGGDAEYITERTFELYTKSTCDRRDENGDCTDYREKALLCENVGVKVALHTKLADISSARVIHAKSLTASEHVSACKEDGFQLDQYNSGAKVYAQAKAQDMATRGTQRIVNTYLKDIAPYYSVISFYFRTKIKFPNDLHNKQFGAGVKMLGRAPVQACMLFNDLDSSIQGSNIDLLFNLAVCDEIQRNFQQASSKYDTITQYFNSQLVVHPKWLLNAKQRLANSMKDTSKIKQQLAPSYK